MTDVCARAGRAGPENDPASGFPPAGPGPTQLRPTQAGCAVTAEPGPGAKTASGVGMRRPQLVCRGCNSPRALRDARGPD